MAEQRTAGLDGPVEIVRDRHGVPHCYARSEHDAFFAQGFVHAADRLWQLDYDRRRGLHGDFYQRVDLGASARRDVALLSVAAREMLTAYAAGVNAVLDQVRAGARPLPREFAAAGLRPPEGWEPWHSIVVYRVRHLTMGSATAKLWRGVVAQVRGPAAARAMTSGRSQFHVTCVPPGARVDGAVPAWAGQADGGSNNWALAGSRTASGLPLLAGDPHRPLEVPNVYAQGHVAGPRFDVLGLSIPGVPGFPHFGHNDRVAWCITHAMADDQDLYEGTGGLAGRGPAIADDLALVWAATAEPNTGFDALHRMLAARSVGELLDSMADWAEPANNLLAADRDGSIGYLTRGRIPVRTRPEAAWLPVPAADSSFGWRGFVAFKDMPRLENPDGGFLLSANNKIMAGDDGPYLGLDVGPPWRAARIADALAGMSGATVADMAALHRDVVSLPARQVLPLLEGWAPVAGWDGRMTADSTAAAAYSVLRRELALLVLERCGLAGAISHRWNRLLPGAHPESVVWRVSGEQLMAGDTSLLGGWSWRQALAEAVRRAERAWDGRAWGELHATAHRHPAGQDSLDPPHVPYGGDMDTVQASSYIPVNGLRTAAGSVARYAFDVANWDNSGWVVPLGAAGEPGSEHFADQQESWRAGQLVPAPYTRPAVQAAMTAQLTLVPDAPD